MSVFVMVADGGWDKQESSENLILESRLSVLKKLSGETTYTEDIDREGVQGRHNEERIF